MPVRDIPTLYNAFRNDAQPAFSDFRDLIDTFATNGLGSGVYNALANSVPGDGLNDASAMLDYIANTTLQPDGGTLLLAGPATYLIRSNITIPANVTLWFQQSAQLKVGSGFTVTINGPLQADLTQLFQATGTDDGSDGSGIIRFGVGYVTTVYPQWWGAQGDGVNDDSVAFVAASEAAPDGGTLDIPIGNHRFATPAVTVRARTRSSADYRTPLNVVGHGMGSAIQLDMASTEDGWTFAGDGYLSGCLFKDFFVYGAANCAKNGLVVENLFRSTVDNVHVWAGVGTGNYAVKVTGLMCSRVNFVVSANIKYPYVGAQPTNGVYIGESAATNPNANAINCIVEGTSNDGLVVHNTAGTGIGGNNEITGTYEGIERHAIWAVNGTGITLHDVHMEYAPTRDGMGTITDSNQDQNDLRLDGCVLVTVKNNYYTTINCYGTSGVTLDQCIGDTLYIHTDCYDTTLRDVTWRTYGGSFTDWGVRTVQTGTLAAVGYATQPQGGIDVLANGNMLAWNDTAPVVWSPTGAGVSGVFEGTIRKFAFGSLKMTGASAKAYQILGSLEKSIIEGQYVTATVWVYIPSGQLNPPELYAAWYKNAGDATVASKTYTDEDVWIPITFAKWLWTDASEIRFYVVNATASDGTWYLGGATAQVGHLPVVASPQRIPRMLSAQKTWDPADFADGASIQTTITVPGALVGDPCQVGFSGEHAGEYLFWSAQVTAANTVTVNVYNRAGTNKDMHEGTLRVDVWQY